MIALLADASMSGTEAVVLMAIVTGTLLVGLLVWTFTR